MFTVELLKDCLAGMDMRSYYMPLSDQIYIMSEDATLEFSGVSVLEGGAKLLPDTPTVQPGKWFVSVDLTEITKVAKQKDGSDDIEDVSYMFSKVGDDLTEFLKIVVRNIG